MNPVQSISNLSDAQQIFCVFYAIFFGIMLQTIGARRSNPQKNSELGQDITFNLFDSPNAYALGINKNNKPLRRLIFSIFAFNIAPGLLFAFIFKYLFFIQKPLSICQILAIIWISLSPHYLYRIAMTILFINKNFFYLSVEKDASQNIKNLALHDQVALCLIETDRDSYSDHRSPVNHILFPLFVFFTYILVLYLLIPGKVQILLLLFEYFLLVKIVLLLILPDKN